MSTKKNSIILSVKRNKLGRPLLSEKQIDLTRLRIKSGGLFTQVLESLPSPVRHAEFHYLERGAELITSVLRARRILSLPISELEETDIQYLYTIVETAIQEKLVRPGQLANGFVFSNAFRRSMKYLDTPLKDGITTMLDVEFKSSFREKVSPRGLLSDLHDPSITDPNMAAPIQSLQADSYDEFLEKDRKHLQVRIEALKTACENRVENYLSLKKELSKYSTALLDARHEAMVEKFEYKSKDWWDFVGQISDQNLLHFIVRVFYYNKLFEIENFKVFYEGLNKVARRFFIFGKIVKRFTDCSESESELVGLSNVGIQANTAPNMWITLIRCTHYIPGSVLIAIRQLLQIETGWNSQACRDISSVHVDKTRDGYSIKTLKTKTDQEQSTFILNGTSLYDAFEAQLEHSYNVDRFWTKEQESIFVELGSSLPCQSAQVRSHQRALDNFQLQYTLPKYSLEMIRDQVLNHKYSVHQDPYKLQSEGDWSNLSTVEKYISQQHQLRQSGWNISRYMEKLQGSIVWATQRHDLAPNLNVDLDKVDRELLFPPSTDLFSDDNNSAVDLWIASEDSGASSTLVLTKDRIKLTYIQTKWYRDVWRELLSENMERFMCIHLPRIIVSLALEKIIIESEYSELYCGNNND